MDNNTVNILIETIKNYPSLWSRQQQNSVDQKASIWKEVSLNVQQPVDKCRAKWRNLRDSYLKSIKWRQKFEEIGQPENHREYKHERQLSFLDVNLKRKRTSGDDDKQSKV
jgi:hypothetical protein